MTYAVATKKLCNVAAAIPLVQEATKIAAPTAAPEHNRECKSPDADSGLPMNPNGEPSRQGKQEKQDCDVVDIEGAHHPGWVVIENGISCLFGI